MNGDADQFAEKLRADILKAPDAAIAAAATAAAKKERRLLNSRMNRVEIMRLNELVATLERNNGQLIAFGDPAIEFTAAADPLDLHWRALGEEITVVDRLVRQQASRLDHLRSRAAAAERERMIANETPTDRRFRLLSEQVEAMESRLAFLEGRVAESERDRQFVAPARPKPEMSGLPVSVGDGLSAGSALPPLSLGRKAR
jgi:hypothetical protein